MPSVMNAWGADIVLAVAKGPRRKPYGEVLPQFHRINAENAFYIRAMAVKGVPRQEICLPVAASQWETAWWTVWGSGMHNRDINPS